jgi:putative copper export protein
MIRSLLLLTTAIAAAFLLIAGAAGSHAAAAEVEPSLLSPDAGVHQSLATNSQDGEDGVSPAENGDSDTRYDVQVWTVAAAAIAASVGLLLFLVRAVTGRVAPPPPQKDSHH